MSIPIPDLPQDSGSAFGHIPPVPDSKRAKISSFLDHSMGCKDCDYGNVRCPVAKRIWREWQALTQ